MKILSVCGMGLGSSLMLRMAVESVLKEMKIDADVEVADVSSAVSMNADIIVASPEIAEQLAGHKAKIVSIKNMTDKTEIKEKLEGIINV
jgi:PTS system ascorbate-specific IIB component